MKQSNFVYLACGLQVMFLAQVTESVLTEGALAQTKKMIKNMCKGKSKVSDADLSKAWTDDFPDSKPLACYMSCALGMMKVMKKSEIDPEGAKKQLKALMPERFQEPMNEQLEKCKDVGGADGCDIGANFIKCAYKVRPDCITVPL